MDSRRTNDGAFAGGVSFVAGKVGQAFNFEGTGEMIAPSTPSLNVQFVTFEVWVNPSVVDSDVDTILNKENDPAFSASDISYEIGIRGAVNAGSGSIPAGHLAFFLGGIANLPDEYGGGWVDGGGAVPTNSWSHCALAFDGTEVRVYINGTLTRTIGGLSGTMNSTTGPFKIGSRSLSLVSGRPELRFNGLIDEVSVYNRALSAGEIQSIFNAGSAGKCPPSPPCVPSPSGLISSWPAEGNGNDATGGNHAVLFNGVTFAPGEVGQGFYFDGVDDRVLVSNSPSLNFGPGADVSIEAWIQPEVSTTTFDIMTIVDKRNAPNISQGIGYELALAGGRLECRISDSIVDVGTSFGAVGPDLRDGRFHHVAVTIARNSTTGGHYYVDGAAVLTFDPTVEPGDLSNDQPLRIGNHATPSVFANFKGRMDEVSIYQRALSAAEVQALYNAGSAGKCVATNPPPCAAAPPGLVSWWQAENNELDSAAANNGTLVGDTTFGVSRVGQGFVFDGSGDVVPVGNPANLQLQDFTIEAWVKRASSAIVSYGSYGNGVIFGFGQGGYGLYLDLDGRPALSKIGISETKPTATITDTNFHHLAVTKLGSAVVFYIDGVAYSAPAYDPGFAFSTVAAIGALADNLDNSFLGTVDEVAVYNRALSGGDIQSIYNAGSQGKCGLLLSMISQPASRTNYVGDNVTFTVVASGSSPLSYQWSLNATNIDGATNASLTLMNVQMTAAGGYSVVVSNALDSVASSNAVLTVNPAPPCIAPASGLVSWWRAEGDASDFVAGNGGTLAGNVSFGVGRVGQGFVLDGNGDGVNLGNPASLQLQNFTIEAWIKRANATRATQDPANINGSILAYGSGGYGFTLLDDGRLDITQVGVGGVFSSALKITDTDFHHVALTRSNSTIVFFVDGVGEISAPYNPTFTFSSSIVIGASGDLTSFWGSIDEVAVYNRALSATEIQSIYSAGGSGKCPLPVAPFIVTQPASKTVTVGNTVVFSATAGGTAPFGYQWSFNTANISGATNASLTLSNVQFSQSGNYSVLVSNAVDSVSSANAVLTVNFPPARVRVVTTNAMAGGSVSVPIILVANGNENALGFSLSFSTQRLAFASVTLGSGTAVASLLPNTSQTNLGRLGVAVSLPSGASFAAGTQEVARVIFTSPVLTGINPVVTTLAFGDQPTGRQLSDAAAHVLPATYSNGSVTLLPSDHLEGDVAPRPTGDRALSITDWVQAGRFVAGLDNAADGGEFQRADCAPRGTSGDGILKVTDWVQAGRYAASLDPLTLVGGPTSPVAEAPSAQSGGISVASGSRQVSVAGATAIQGVKVTLPVSLESQGNESALGLSLVFDSTKFSYAGVSLGNGAAGATLNVNTNLVANGKLGLALAFPNGSFATGLRELAKVNLIPTLSGVGNDSVVFGDQPVTRAVSDPAANELTADYVPGTVVVNPLPSLTIKSSGASVSLSWPVWADGFTLQISESNVLMPGNWTNVVATLQTNASDIVLTIPASETTKFFRLHHP